MNFDDAKRVFSFNLGAVTTRCGDASDRTLRMGTRSGLRAVARNVMAVALLVGACAFNSAYASTASIVISATVVQVSCTAAQRVHVRACAPVQEKYSVESTGSVGVPLGATAVVSWAPKPQIVVDQERRVVFRTLVY